MLTETLTADNSTMEPHHVLCECEALDRRWQAVYLQMKLSLDEYDKQPTNNLYRLVHGTRMLDWGSRANGRKCKSTWLKDENGIAIEVSPRY